MAANVNVKAAFPH